jgi:hypothetical protein
MIILLVQKWSNFDLIFFNDNAYIGENKLYKKWLDKKHDIN